MARWARICQQCWEVCNNDQYWPDEPRGGYAEGCDACRDEFALSVNVHPAVVEETIVALEEEHGGDWESHTGDNRKPGCPVCNLYEWCLHCGAYSCQHAIMHNAALGRSAL